MSIANSLAEMMRDTDAMRHLHAIAECYARLPRKSLQSREIVGDVIEEALSGVLICDPAALVKRLAGEVRRRAERVRSEARSGKFVCIDDVRPSLLPNATQTPSLGESDGIDLNDLDNEHVMPEIRTLARGDTKVLQLLDLYEREFYRQSDALRAGMSLSAWRAARHRLDGYAARVLAAQNHEPAADAGPRSDEPPARNSRRKTATSATMFLMGRIGARTVETAQRVARAPRHT